MTYLKCTCLAAAIALCYSPIFCQTAVEKIDSLAGKVVMAVRAENKEKILLQTDRKVYAAGEKIWFQAFLVKALNNRIDTASKNLFVDLVNDNDVVIKQLVLNTVKRSTTGAVVLSDSLATGYYWLRSYTQKMVSDDPGNIFIQPVYIMNIKKPGSDAPAPATKMDGKPDIQFFPEGGTIITGINSTGVLQVKDAGGNPVVANGYVVNNKDSQVAVFNTNRFGLARMTFYPKWFETYRAIIHTDNGDVRFALGGWNPFAAQVSVIKQDHESLQTYITLEDSIYTRKYTTYLLAVSRDSVCFAGVGRGMCQVDIPLKDFPGGPATLLLFNEDKQLLSEREVFIYKNNYNLDVTTDKPSYAARDKVTLTAQLTGADGRPLVGDFSVAVEDDRIMQMSDVMESDTLQPAGLSFDDWLSRDQNRLSREEIDLMMLAQPPHYKYRYPAGVAADAYTDNNELLLNLEGKVSDRKKTPLPARVVTEISKNGDNTFLDIDTTGIGGGFRLTLPENRENMTVMVQVADRRGALEPNAVINVDTFGFPKFATPASLKNKFVLAPVSPQVQVKKYHLDTVFIGVGKEWLAPVTVKTKAKKPDTYNTSKRINPFSYIISSDMINQGGYGNAANMLLNVPGVSLRGGFLAFYGGSGFGADASQEPIIVMDGVVVPALEYGGASGGVSKGVPLLGTPVGSQSPVLQFLSSIDPATIDFIEVLRGADAGTFGVAGGHGAIVINTKTHIEGFSTPPAAIRFISPRTYHIPPAFVMPDYADRDIKSAKASDLRNTIYWKGNLLTDPAGKASVSFYTADAATTYSIVISGITANGDYVYKRIKINRK